MHHSSTPDETTDYPHFDSEYPHTVSGIRERKDLTP